MTKLFTLFTLFFLLSFNSFSNKHLKGTLAEEAIPGSSEVWFKTDAELPSFIRFREDFILNEKDLMFWLKAQFDLQDGLSLQHIGSIDGSSGLTHEA